MRNQLQRLLFLAVCFALGIAPGALAEGEPISRVQPQQVIRDIPSLNEVEQPLTSAEGLLVQQPAPALAQVTGVQLKPTDKGLEVLLETTSEFAEVLNSETENTLITDIPNAQLRLPKGGAFRQDNPTPDIAFVEVVNLDAKTLRVTVTGKAGVPTAEVSQSPQALILSVAAPPAPPELTPAPSPAVPPVTPAPSAEPQQPAAPEAPTPGPQAEEERLELTVTAEEEAGGYFVPDTSVGTRSDTPLRDIPQSIQVVPQEVLRDQNVTRLDEVIRNVPGLTLAESSSQIFGGFTSRGFRINAFNTNDFLRDGLRDPAGQFLIDFTNVERIEFLKGPASALYGVGSPGGKINLVTKQPLSEPFYAVDATIGSYDFYRGAIDLSGPLNDSRSVLYRLNASYQDRKSFVDFYEYRGPSVAPTLSFALGEKTRLFLEGDYSNRSSTFLRGLPAIGTVLPNPNGEIPRNRYTGEPGELDERTAGRVGYRLEHQFSDNWSLRGAFRATFFETFVDATFSESLDADDRTLNRYRIRSGESIDIYSLTAELIGKFSTGSIDHQLVFGTAPSRFAYSVRGGTRPAAPIDLFDPVYRQSRVPVPPITYSSDLLTDTLGIYVQDQVTLTENLKLWLGGEFDLFRQTDRDFLADTETSQSGDAFSPFVGIDYQPVKPISLYASYGRSFQPTIGRAFDDSVFQPERGTQYEVGVKVDVSDQLLATLALYDLTRSNVLVDDTSPGVPPGFSIQTGKQRSRGIELNIQGQILPGWNIIAGYAYTDAQVTEDTNPELVDKRLNNVPKNAFNVWTTYEIQQGTLQGLGAGLGFFFVGDRQGDLANTFELPSYFRTDAAIFYKRDQFRAALNFKNLLNVNYFETAENNLNVFYGDPFTVQGTVSWQF